MTQDAASAAVHTDVAHPARRYNYWLGGKDNFAADRESAGSSTTTASSWSSRA